MGSDEYNMKLSKRRAEYVKKQLVGLGINSKRITTVGMGKKNPVATNETAEGRQLNRRVEFRLCEPTDAEMAKPEGKGGNSGNNSNNSGSIFKGNKNSGY